jgi:hypothetical protein
MLYLILHMFPSGGRSSEACQLTVRIGTALTDALDELITEGDIPPQLAMRVLQQVHLVSSSSPYILSTDHSSYPIFLLARRS